jgi:hypothetical protein
MCRTKIKKFQQHVNLIEQQLDTTLPLSRNVAEAREIMAKI